MINTLLQQKSSVPFVCLQCVCVCWLLCTFPERESHGRIDIANYPPLLTRAPDSLILLHLLSVFVHHEGTKNAAKNVQSCLWRYPLEYLEPCYVLVITDLSWRQIHNMVKTMMPVTCILTNSSHSREGCHFCWTVGGKLSIWNLLNIGTGGEPMLPLPTS